MQIAQLNEGRHHPVVEAKQAERAADLQLRIADWITAFAGSMPFVYLHVALFARSMGSLPNCMLVCWISPPRSPSGLRVG
jgi:hypothetical protein